MPGFIKFEKMCFRNCWYAAIFESHANSPKLKTGETVSRFDLNSSVKQLFRGESLLQNQKINQAGLILDHKIEISELQPRISLLFNRLFKIKCRLTHNPKCWNQETRKTGNPDHPEIGKAVINQNPKAIPKITDSYIRLRLLLDVETRKR